MLAWLAPLIVFGLVVFVHELGHFLAAKITGVYAPVFSFGWGPRLWGFRRGETDYRVSWLPVGGFVAMATRDSEGGTAIEGDTALGTEVEADDRPGHQRGFNPVPFDPQAMRPFGPRPVPRERWVESKPLWAKVFVLAAGVIMNLVLAVVVNSASVYHYGRPFALPVVDSVQAGGAAALAGFQRGDTVVAIDGTPIRRWDEMVDRVTAAPGQALHIDVMRAGTRVSLVATPAAAQEPDRATGAPVTVGRLGVIRGDHVRREEVSAGEAVASGWKISVGMASDVFKVVAGLFNGQVSVKQLGGPIRIAQVSFETAKTGLENLIYLLAFLSVNIAVLNLVPLPLLDGGQILLRVIEAAKGSEFSLRTQEMIARTGVALILAVFVLVMFNDLKALLFS